MSCLVHSPSNNLTACIINLNPFDIMLGYKKRCFLIDQMSYIWATVSYRTFTFNYIVIILIPNDQIMTKYIRLSNPSFLVNNSLLNIHFWYLKLYFWYRTCVLRCILNSFWYTHTHHYFHLQLEVIQYQILDICHIAHTIIFHIKSWCLISKSFTG